MLPTLNRQKSVVMNRLNMFQFKCDQSVVKFKEMAFAGASQQSTSNFDLDTSNLYIFLPKK